MVNELVKIVVTGPESTGKTEICKYLSGIFKSRLIPEYARTYIEALKRPYSFEDVEHIARIQQQDFEEQRILNPKLIILDTYLIITKIWFKEVYNRIPDWIDRALRNAGIDLCLLCYPDIDWINDPVRENPGERRFYLFDQYRGEIELLQIPYMIISGVGKERFKNAEQALLNHFPHLKNEIR